MLKKMSFLGLMLALMFSFSSCKQEAKNTDTVNATTQKTHPAQKSHATTSKTTPSDHLNTGGMQWMTFDEVSTHKNTEGKKYLVDVYTEWCGWCKVMDRKTFTLGNFFPLFCRDVIKSAV